MIANHKINKIIFGCILNNKNINIDKKILPSLLDNLFKIFKFGRSESYLINYIKLHSNISIPKSRKNIFRILKNNANLRTLNSLKILESATKIFYEFNKRKIRFIPLKGLQFLYLYKINVSIRPIRDIDILVDVNEIHKVINALNSIGFFFDDRRLNTSFVLKNYSNFYDLPPMYNKERVCVEIHYKILNKESCRFTQTLLGSNQYEMIGDLKIPKITPEHLMIHVIYHATSKQGFDVGIQAILDFLNIIRLSDVDIDKLIRISKDYDLFGEVSLFINLANKYNYLDINEKPQNRYKKYSKDSLKNFEDLILCNNITHSSFNLIRYGFKNLMKKNFSINILKSNTFSQKKPLINIFNSCQHLFIQAYKLLYILIKMTFVSSFRKNNIKAINLLKEIKE